MFLTTGTWVIFHFLKKWSSVSRNVTNGTDNTMYCERRKKNNHFFMRDTIILFRTVLYRTVRTFLFPRIFFWNYKFVIDGSLRGYCANFSVRYSTGTRCHLAFSITVKNCEILTDILTVFCHYDILPVPTIPVLYYFLNDLGYPAKIDFSGFFSYRTGTSTVPYFPLGRIFFVTEILVCT